MAMNNDKRMIRRIAHSAWERLNPTDSIILSIEDYKDAYGLNPTDKEGSEKKMNQNFVSGNVVGSFSNS